MLALLLAGGIIWILFDGTRNCKGDGVWEIFYVPLLIVLVTCLLGTFLL